MEFTWGEGKRLCEYAEFSLLFTCTDVMLWCWWCNTWQTERRNQGEPTNEVQLKNKQFFARLGSVQPNLWALLRKCGAHAGFYAAVAGQPVEDMKYKHDTN